MNHCRRVVALFSLSLLLCSPAVAADGEPGPGALSLELLTDAHLVFDNDSSHKGHTGVAPEEGDKGDGGRFAYHTLTCIWEPAKASAEGGACSNTWPDPGDSLGGMIGYSQNGMFNGAQAGRNVEAISKRAAEAKALGEYGSGKCANGRDPLMMTAPSPYYSTTSCDTAYNRRYNEYAAAPVTAADRDAIVNNPHNVSQPSQATADWDPNSGQPFPGYPALERILQECTDLGYQDYWNANWSSVSDWAAFYVTFPEGHANSDRIITYCESTVEIAGEYCCPT